MRLTVGAGGATVDGRLARPARATAAWSRAAWARAAWARAAQAATAVARAGRDGWLVGVVVAAAVAAVAFLQYVVWGADARAVGPLVEALRFPDDAEPPGGMGAALAGLVGMHLALAGVTGAGIGVALQRDGCPWAARVAAAVLVGGTEYAAWRLAGWHVGPWLRVAVWYHLVTTTLVLVAALGGARVGPEDAPPARARGV